ncbi:glucose 1-dehydrogenase [Patescibacteria group bacterium]|nr:glucose 1-dehydrogenase [Patescibacteria group bacterium]MBU1685314.1 glucose 1-dehydrogenase [Patescibacteria group bacterium]MBU1938948.1 glucose 1-dehydrogenase [Patescibacteria group bacterium]
MKNKKILSKFDLTGKTAILTGASRGLGKAMALGLAQAGANIVITDVLDTKKTVKEIESLGVKAMGLKVDVTRKGDIDKMVKKTLQKFKKIDILVNNAGVYFPTPVKDVKEKDWDKIIGINLKGTMMCAQAVGKEMCKEKSGSIINIASVAGIMAFAQSAAYNTSKAAIIMLTKTLATEWASCGIRVNAICPGIFATDMTKGLLKDKGFQTMVKTKIPMARYAVPEELAGAALYLASDASSYTTGHALVVDGGWTVGL